MVERVYFIPGAPRIALLSDLHGRPYEAVISSVQRHRPELICIAGDIVYGSFPEDDQSPLDTQENVLPFLSACAALGPTFLSLGNHELHLDEADLSRIADTGVTILDNRWVERDGVVIGGLSSGYVTAYRRFVGSLSPKERAGVRYPEKESLEGIGGVRTASEHKPDVNWLAAFAAAPGYHILLSHHPEYWPEVKEKTDLMLSGHAHGGQIRLFKHGLWSPGQGFWPRWTKGVYENGRLVVSAGLSNTTWAPRLFNPVEVVYVEQLSSRTKIQRPDCRDPAGGD